MSKGQIGHADPSRTAISITYDHLNVVMCTTLVYSLSSPGHNHPHWQGLAVCHASQAAAAIEARLYGALKFSSITRHVELQCRVARRQDMGGTRRVGPLTRRQVRSLANSRVGMFFIEFIEKSFRLGEYLCFAFSRPSGKSTIRHRHPRVI
jgi:hypothetical protein